MKKMLENNFTKYDTSHNSTLLDDITKAEIIISFSVDANIVCMLERKKIVFCGEQEADDLTNFGNTFDNLKVVTSIDALSDVIKNLFKSDLKLSKL